MCNGKTNEKINEMKICLSFLLEANCARLKLKESFRFQSAIKCRDSRLFYIFSLSFDDNHDEDDEKENEEEAGCGFCMHLELSSS